MGKAQSHRLTCLVDILLTQPRLLSGRQKMKDPNTPSNYQDMRKGKWWQANENCVEYQATRKKREIIR